MAEEENRPLPPDPNAVWEYAKKLHELANKLVDSSATAGLKARYDVLNAQLGKLGSHFGTAGSRSAERLDRIRDEQARITTYVGYLNDAYGRSDWPQAVDHAAGGVLRTISNFQNSVEATGDGTTIVDRVRSLAERIYGFGARNAYAQLHGPLNMVLDTLEELADAHTALAAPAREAIELERVGKAKEMDDAVRASRWDIGNEVTSARSIIASLATGLAAAEPNERGEERARDVDIDWGGLGDMPSVEDLPEDEAGEAAAAEEEPTGRPRSGAVSAGSGGSGSSGGESSSGGGGGSSGGGSGGGSSGGGSGGKASGKSGEKSGSGRPRSEGGTPPKPKAPAVDPELVRYLDNLTTAAYGAFGASMSQLVAGLPPLAGCVQQLGGHLAAYHADRLAAAGPAISDAVQKLYAPYGDAVGSRRGPEAQADAATAALREALREFQKVIDVDTVTLLERVVQDSVWVLGVLRENSADHSFALHGPWLGGVIGDCKAMLESCSLLSIELKEGLDLAGVGKAASGKPPHAGPDDALDKATAAMAVLSEVAEAVQAAPPETAEVYTQVCARLDIPASAPPGQAPSSGPDAPAYTQEDIDAALALSCQNLEQLDEGSVLAVSVAGPFTHIGGGHQLKVVLDASGTVRKEGGVFHVAADPFTEQVEATIRDLGFETANGA